MEAVRLVFVIVFIVSLAACCNLRNVACNAIVRNEISKYKNETNCKPRQKVVELAMFLKGPRSSGSMITPKYILVDLCEGGSNLNNKCIMDEPQYKTFYYQESFTSGAKCRAINITMHKSCKSGCPLHEKEECNRNTKKFYNDINCSCECKNKYNICDDNMYWDTNFCGCKCEETKECSTGFVWVAQYCICMKMKEEAGEMFVIR